MALINRVSRLFKADFHAVLDQIEEPEQLLKQAIRDMEDELQSSEQRIATCAHECENLSQRQAELDSSIREVSEQLALCFESGKDELARGLIRKRLEAERVLKRINSRLDANAAYLADQRRLLEEPFRLVTSRRHGIPEGRQLAERLSRSLGDVVICEVGSSLKFCHVAEGHADLYPRFAPTSEWDTAAGQAILEAAGGRVVGLDFHPLAYNSKSDFLNPFFYGLGDSAFPWQDLLTTSGDDLE